MTAFDDLYGACIAPARKEPFEDHKPRSWLRLVGSDVERFHSYVNDAIVGGYMAVEFFEKFTTLWLVDAGGELLVAVEEAVHAQTDEGLETYPLPRLGLRPANGRLGHPSLVEGGSARIGGELHVRANDQTVYIDNRSGRFGLMRTPEQLDAAGALFTALGFEVSTQHFRLQIP